MTTPRILSCGEVLWDLFPAGPRFGGAPANFACHAAILGGEVSILSAVGQDPRGKAAIDILQSFGVNTFWVQTLAGTETGCVSVRLDAAGKPSFQIQEGVAWDQIQWKSDLPGHLSQLDAIYFGTLGQRGPASRATLRRALSHAQECGIPRVLDVNLRPPFYDPTLIRESVTLASILKLSDDELLEVSTACGIVTTQTAEDTLRTLRERFDLQCVVMTRGAQGALMVSDKGTAEQPGIPTQVVDTVGAGDSFTAAFVLGWLHGDPPQEILRKACENATLTCAHSGAVPPSLQ